MIIYDIFFIVFSIAYLPYLILKGKAHRRFKERFGVLPEAFKRSDASKPIWIHAVSVGEVVAAKAILEEINSRLPAQSVVLSTTTTTGREIAEKNIDDKILKFYFPVDLSLVVKRVIERINPKAVLIMETEIWPNLILALSKKKVPVAIINGRISDKSYRGYKKIRVLFKSILKKLDLFCMQTLQDAERIESLGAPKDKIKVTGNIKFDLRTTMKTSKSGINRSSLGIKAPQILIIAGSTHPPEEEILIETYAHLRDTYPDVRLLIAPRHVERAENIGRLIERKGFKSIFVSRHKEYFESSAKRNPIFILDTIGELATLYSLADIVFMGGSLVKRGGHNIVEPAIFGKAIIFGPYMTNFRGMEKLFLQHGAAIKVKSRDEFHKSLEALLTNRKKRDLLGRNAAGIIEASKGATRNTINELARILSNIH